MSTDPTELEAPDPSLSLDANDSTYAQASDSEPQNPPSGPRVEQTLGQPGSGGAVQAAPKTTRSSGSTSS